MSNIDNYILFRYHIQRFTYHPQRGGIALTSFMLRMLALFSMVVDHAGLALFPRIGAFRCAGRLAFPLYCFLLVQGYIHTRDLRAYTRRLLLLAFLSEIPFDLLIFGRVASGMEQNVLFSLLLGLAAVYAAHRFEQEPQRAAMNILLLLMASMLLWVSYGWLGIALCLCFYKLRHSRVKQALGILFIEGLYCLSLALSGVETSWVLVSLCAMLAAIPVLLYNGKPGLRHKFISFLFYAAYPLHIIALLIIRAMRIVPPYMLG